MEVTEEADDGVARTAVEVAGRLVGEHDRRVADEGAGDGNALALAARQGAGSVQRPLGEPDGVERLAGLAQPLATRDTGVQQAVGDVLQGGEPLDEVELLEHEADAPAPHGREPAVAEAADVAPVDADGAAGRSLQCADDVHQRRLPGARRADDDDELARRHQQVDAVERPHRWRSGVVLGDPAELEDGAAVHWCTIQSRDVRTSPDITEHQ